MFIPHKTFSVIRDPLVHVLYNASKMRGVWSTKKIENTILHWVDLKYCSKRVFSAFYLCILEIFSAAQRQAMNGGKKQLQSRWNDKRGTLVGETKETESNEKRDTPPTAKSKGNHIAGVSEMHRAVRPSQPGTPITAPTTEQSPFTLAIWRAHLLYGTELLAPKSLQSKFIKIIHQVAGWRPNNVEKTGQ